MSENGRLKIVGVIGGMGPEATRNFYGRLIARSEARRDQDHVPVIIHSLPQVPDRDDAIAGKGPSPRNALVAMAKSLERAGAGMLVMPCASAHVYEPAVREAVKLPFISMVEEACEEVLRRDTGAKKVGILSEQGALDAKLFDIALTRRQLEPVPLDFKERAIFQKVLHVIKSGQRDDKVKAAVVRFFSTLVERGADVVIVGCAELPLVLGHHDVDRPVIDAVDVLAERCVLYARDLVLVPRSALPA